MDFPTQQGKCWMKLATFMKSFNLSTILLKLRPRTFESEFNEILQFFNDILRGLRRDRRKKMIFGTPTDS